MEACLSKIGFRFRVPRDFVDGEAFTAAEISPFEMHFSFLFPDSGFFLCSTVSSMLKYSSSGRISCCRVDVSVLR